MRGEDFPRQHFARKQRTLIRANVRDDNYWRDVWRHRELALFLAWRDLLVRYKQTFVGIAWTVLRPLATVMAYTLVFGIIARLPSEGVPYSLLVLSGLLPWQLFSLALVATSESLFINIQLINKVYFPRIIVPFSSIVIVVVDHLITFALIFLMLAWYGFTPSWTILLLPLVTVGALLTSLGLGLITAALNAHYRDFRQLIPIALQLGVFLCPVAYATSLVPESWRFFYALNPIVGIIDAFRWCILGRADLIYPPSILITIIFTAVMLIVGVRIFRRLEASFSDVM